MLSWILSWIFFSLHLFRIRICEEKRKKPSPSFGDVYGLVGQRNTEYFFLVNTFAVVSAGHKENFNNE